jgi:hypothetical protein
VHLLACIRRSGERIRPASVAERAARPVRWYLLAPFRVYRPLADLPLRSPKDPVFYIPGHPRPNSKTAAVVNELLQAGIPREKLLHGSANENSVWLKIARLAVRLPWGLLFTWIIRRRKTRLDSVDRQTLLGYAFARRWLSRHPGVKPIIISDVSPMLNTLWTAAAREGNRAIWWQDDFHHSGWLPYNICAAALLNEPGYKTAVNRNPGALFVARPTEPPLPLRRIPEKPVVGVATNASFRAGQTELNFLKALAASMGVEKLQLRLHPNSRLTQSDFHGAPVTVAPRAESMKDFAARIDVGVVGNSASQIWLLRNGVPVVHVAGLDEDGFDLYGYCRKGLICPPSGLNKIALDLVKDFYGKTCNEKSPYRVIVPPDQESMKLTELAILIAEQASSVS